LVLTPASEAVLVGASGGVYVYDWESLALGTAAPYTPSLLKGGEGDVFRSVLAANVTNLPLIDLVLAAPGANRGDGVLYVLPQLGPDFGEISLEAFAFAMRPQPGTKWGIGAQLAAGELDGDDSHADLIVTAPGFDDDAGLAVVFFGPLEGLDQFLQGGDVFITSEEPGSLITAVLSADLNQDSYDDLIVGAPGYNERGAVFFFMTHGAPLFDTSQGPIWLDLLDADRQATYTVGDALCIGATLTFIEDLIDDATPELVIGAPCSGTHREGEVVVVSGGVF